MSNRLLVTLLSMALATTAQALPVCDEPETVLRLREKVSCEFLVSCKKLIGDTSYSQLVAMDTAQLHEFASIVARATPPFMKADNRAARQVSDWVREAIRDSILELPNAVSLSDHRAVADGQCAAHISINWSAGLIKQVALVAAAQTGLMKSLVAAVNQNKGERIVQTILSEMVSGADPLVEKFSEKEIGYLIRENQSRTSIELQME